MFWRLFLTYVLLVAATVLLVGALVLNRAEHLFWDLTRDFALVVAAVFVLSVPVAYLLAVRFTRPLESLAADARRLAEGDLQHPVVAGGGPEVESLGRTLNEMRGRLAASFAEVGRDRERLRTILSGMVEGVVAFDADRQVLFANERAAELLEFPPGGAVGRKMWEVVRQRAVVEAAEKGLAEAVPHRVEVDWQGPAGRSLAVYVSRLTGPDRAGAVMVVHDVSELRRLERLRQEFVANVSHELKTPLANIKSAVEVLIDGAAEEPGPRGEFLAQIDDQATRLDALVADLIGLARIESGAAALEFEAVPVEEAVHACLDRHRTRAEAKKHTLNGVALAGCPPTLAVWADEEGLARVLDNLVDNAIKYTPAGGRVTVRWEATPQQVCLEVEDTGIGIPERDLPRVFERFYRVDRARSREMGGTGLGLSIVKHMTQAMGGTVRVASEVTRGTTFRVCLPRVGGG